MRRICYPSLLFCSLLVPGALAAEGPFASLSFEEARKKAGAEKVAGVYLELSKTIASEFSGYGAERLDDVRAAVLLRDGRQVETLEEGAEGEVILDVTPFYAESGGQVADTGYLVAPSGHAEVIDVQRPSGGLIVHRVRLEAGALFLHILLLAFFAVYVLADS